MSKTKKIISSVLFISVLIAGFYMLNVSRKSKNITSDVFTVKNTSDISKIIITEDEKSVTLTEKNGEWIVDGKYPANKKSIKKMYQLLTETKISKPVPAEKKDSVINLLSKKGKTVSIRNKKNKEIKKLTIGKYDKKLKGTYMITPEIKEPFAVNIPGVTDDLNYRWNINPVYWLKPEIFSYKPKDIKEITLTYPDSSKSSFKLKIYKDTAELFRLPENEKINNINLKKTGSYLSYFMNVKFYSEINNTSELIDSLKNRQPKSIISVTDTEGKGKNVKLYEIYGKNGKKDLNNLYAVINNQDAVKVKYIDFDLILKDISYFLN